MMFIGIIKDGMFLSGTTRNMCIIYTMIYHILNVIGIIGKVSMEICGILNRDTTTVVAKFIKALGIGVGVNIKSIRPLFGVK